MIDGTNKVQSLYLPEVLTGERLFEISVGLPGDQLYQLRVAGSGILVFNDYPLEIHTGMREIRSGNQVVDSTKLEFDLMRYLAENPDNTKTREEILEAIWVKDGKPYVGDTHVVDVHNSNMKNKFNAQLGEQGIPYPIRTVRGVGFVFASKPRRG